MTQDELKLVLEALKWCHGGEPCGTAEAIAVVEKALAQRTWVGLTDDEMEATFIECGGKWNGDFWKIEDADFHPFLRTIEAKLKQVNGFAEEKNT